MSQFTSRSLEESASPAPHPESLSRAPGGAFQCRITPKRLALHGEGVPAEVLPADPENSREARAGRARLAMLAGHPDLDEQQKAWLNFC
jgi:hypothetical protein